MKLLITGGHVTPALAVLDALKTSPYANKVEVLFVGRKYISEEDKTKSFEYQEIEKRGVPFIHLTTGRLTRIFSFESLKNVMRIPGGFISAFKILNEHKPDKIISFGGYLALPVAICGFFMGITIYTHEQTIAPGITNQIIAGFAKRVFYSFKESQSYFPQQKSLYSGNPVRQSIFSSNNELFKDVQKEVIFVTGGSLGSHSVNLHIKSILPALLKKYVIIHQTGDTKEFNDFEVLNNYKSTLSPELQKNYFLFKHLFDDQIGSAYKVCDMVVSRAGANTVAELIALQKPAILIPLPWSAREEQQKHAHFFKSHGLGEVFLQSEKSENLESLIEDVMTKKEYYKNNFTNLKDTVKINAAEFILKEVLEN